MSAARTPIVTKPTLWHDPNVGCAAAVILVPLTALFVAATLFGTCAH